MVLGIHEKRGGVLQPKHLFCVDLGRNSLNLTAQLHHRRCSKTHIITTITPEMCVLVHIYALYFTVVDAWRRSGGVLSQKVVQSIAGACKQFGQEAGWCLEFMKSMWEITCQNTYFVCI